MSLSVVLATYNEEKNLKRCLDSIQDIASEIVLVDGTSTDKTVEIAQNYTKNITITTNPQIFHINKQKAIDKAKSDWILQLDADEVVSKKLAQEITDITNGKADCNGYWVPRKNWFLGRFLMKGGQYPDYTLRLYKKGKAYLPQKDVHEQAVVEGKVGYLDHPLLHYPYKSFLIYFEKWNRYNAIFANQIKEEFQKKNAIQKIFAGIGYVVVKPIHWFLWTYIRHKGILDAWPGFVFSLFSALRFPVSLIQYLKKKSSYSKLLFFITSVLILALAFYLRSKMFLSGDFFYLVDQARDLMLIKEIVTTANPTLIGARAGIGGLFHGPLWFYMNIPLFLVTGGNPFATLVPMFVGVSLAIIGFAFLSISRLYEKLTATVYATFLGISSLYITTVPFTTNAQVMPIIFLVYMFCVFLFLRGSQKALIAAAFSIGIGFHFESAFAVMLIPITILALLIRFEKIKPMYILLSVGAFLLAVSNFILFELKHGFLMTKSAQTLLQGGIEPVKGFERYSDVVFRIFDRVTAYTNSLNAPFFITNSVTQMILIIVLGGAFLLLVKEILHTRVLSTENKEYIFVLLTPIIIFVLYIFYPFPLWEHYILPIGIVTILYFTLSLRKIYKYKNGYLIAILVFGIVLQPVLFSIFSDYNTRYSYPKNTSDGSYRNQLAVVDWVYNDVKNKEFGYFVYMPSVFTYNMDYLFWWKSQIYENRAIAEKKQTTYLIMYPTTPGSHEYWKKNVIKTSAPVVERKLFTGGILVEKLQITEIEEPVDPNYFINTHFR